MTRICKTCRRPRPLVDFDLSGSTPHVSCLACERGPVVQGAAHEREELRARHEQIADLEKRRRGMIASLVRIDAEIAALRAGPSASAKPAPSDFGDGGGDDDPSDVFS